MPSLRQFNRLRIRRVALAAGGVGAALVAVFSAIGPTETTASFADDVWSKAGFTAATSSSFKLQSSLTAERNYSDNGAGSPLELPGGPTGVTFSTPISLTPGATSFAPVYLRTSQASAKGATVGISTAAKRSGVTSNSDLWGTTTTAGYITYAARAVPVPIPSSPPTCGSSVFSPPSGTWLFGAGTNNASNVALSTAATPAQTFTLNSAGSSTYMVCFRFTLASGVTATPAANGASVYPVWTFTGTLVP